MTITPEIIGLLAATLVFVVGIRAYRKMTWGSRASKRMQALLGDDLEGQEAIAPAKVSLVTRLEDQGIASGVLGWYGVIAGAAIVGFVVAQSAGLPLLPCLMAGGAAALFPNNWLRNRERKRDRAISDALPEGLTILASTLRTFPDLKVALSRTAKLLYAQGYEELAKEFDRLSVDVGVLGGAEAVRRFKARTTSDTLRYTCTLLGIYARQGGKVLPALASRAENLRMLIDARKDAETAVSDARIAGLAVPAIMALVVLANLRDPLAREVYRTALGQGLIVAAAASCYVGYRVVVSMAENLG